MSAPRIDLSCDLGEGAGNDAEIIAHVTSASVACGGHAGDESTMRAALEMASRAGVAVGAHPGLPDRAGFGRRAAEVTPGEAYSLVARQTRALLRLAAEAGVELQHVKPHGALYNQAARDPALARAVARAVRDVDPALVLFGLAGSELLAAARALDLTAASEAFADRGYLADGTLVPRARPDALVQDPDEAVRRAVRLARDGVVETVEGGELRLRADTLCVHGDAPAAPEMARRVRDALAAAGVEVRAVGRGLAAG